MTTTVENYVTVSISDNVVRLVLNGDETDPVEYGADLNLKDKAEIRSVTKANGSPPNGLNMRALMNCNGGTLVFKNEDYKITVQRNNVSG